MEITQRFINKRVRRTNNIFEHGFVRGEEDLNS